MPHDLAKAKIRKHHKINDKGGKTLDQWVVWILEFGHVFVWSHLCPKLDDPAPQVDHNRSDLLAKVHDIEAHGPTFLHEGGHMDLGGN